MAQRFGIVHASTGDIFRAALSDGSELGEAVRGYLDGGLLVPDEMTSRVVEERVIGTTDGFILDGYPRTLAQAGHLEAALEQRGARLDCVVCFELSDADAVERLTGRLVCSGCGRNYHRRFMPPAQDGVCDDCGAALEVRSDSSEDVVRRRLDEYHEKTEPLIEFYRERDLMEDVDASAAPQDVSEATETILARYRAG